LFAIGALMIASTLSAQTVPENAWSSGSSWYCNDGYRRQGDKCVAFEVPENAWVSGSAWYCNDGYRRQGDRCVAFAVPDNAWVSGSSWYCNDGYRRDGDRCVRFNVPENAWVSGGSWYCNDGFRRQGNECVRFAVPENAIAQGGMWVCREGFRREGERCIQMSPEEIRALEVIESERRAAISDGTVAYVSKVSSDDGDILKLANGAVLEVTGGGFLGFLGFNKTAVLYGSGQRCRIWIEGKRSYTCELYRGPSGNGEPAKEVHISSVKGNGALLILLDGAIYEVDAIDQIYTSLWLGVSDGLLINDSTMVNFSADEPVSVHRLR
jgi:hypothetical protein